MTKATNNDLGIAAVVNSIQKQHPFSARNVVPCGTNSGGKELLRMHVSKSAHATSSCRGNCPDDISIVQRQREWKISDAIHWEMSFWQELNSWWAPSGAPATATPAAIGSEVPETPKLGLEPGRPAVVAFLRHCGCPFAEKTFLNLREAAKENKHVDFVVVSHSDEESTDKWLKALPQAGSEPSNVRVVVDHKLEIYAAWGLGPSSYAHVLAPASMWSAWKLGRDEGIDVRPTESGSRWQTSGTFAVDADGILRWGGPAGRADEIPALDAAVQSLSSSSKAKL